MKKISNKELQVILENHVKWLNDNEGGEKANLRCVDLYGADLGGADLKGADLKGADLRYANLRYANLRHVNLENVNLKGVNLESAELKDTELKGANLNGANLDYATLQLHCNFLNFKIDERLAKQFLYHIMSLLKYSEFDLEKYFTKEAFKFVNESHLINKYGLKKINVK